MLSVNEEAYNRFKPSLEILAVAVMVVLFALPGSFNPVQAASSRAADAALSSSHPTAEVKSLSSIPQAGPRAGRDPVGVTQASEDESGDAKDDSPGTSEENDADRDSDEEKNSDDDGKSSDQADDDEKPTDEKPAEKPANDEKESASGEADAAEKEDASKESSSDAKETVDDESTTEEAKEPVAEEAQEDDAADEDAAQESTEDTPKDTSTGDEESTEQPAEEEKQSEEEPVDTKPTDEKPADEELAEEAPADPPAEDEPAKPDETEPVTEAESDAPVESDPVIEEEPGNAATATRPPPIVEETEVPPEGIAMHKRIIGSTATFMELQSELFFLARVDTGAKSCSLHVERIVIENEAENMADNIGKVIRFLIKNHKGETEWIESKIEGYVIVRSGTNTTRDQRYKVPVTFRWRDVEKTVLVTLTDRAHMEYPLLIGRNFLLGQFVVDVELDNTD